MVNDIDISESKLLLEHPAVLKRLLRCHSRFAKYRELHSKDWKGHEDECHIIWATDDYAKKGNGFRFQDQIEVKNITGKNGLIIRPRAIKSAEEQSQRSKNMAEVFTPTWICNAQNNLIDNAWFPENSESVEKQRKAPIRVIIGNPPYSIGQKSANDNAQNQSYPILDKRITDTYVAESAAGLNKSSYDAYIKAFRWASDKISQNKEGGVIGFISNGAWLDGNSTDGFRKCLEKEFDSIYVFNLRGNQRTSGELSRKEGGKIFGSGSRTPIAITILVKKGVE